MIALLQALLAFTLGPTGLVDAARITAHADLLRVPRVVAWSVAWAESGDGRRGNHYLGPGIVLLDSTGAEHRVCREVGRFQLRPCNAWTWLSPACTPRAIRLDYDTNVRCGLLYLRSLRTRFGSWPAAIHHYNGSIAYRDRVLARIGYYTLMLPPDERHAHTP